MTSYLQKLRLFQIKQFSYDAESMRGYSCVVFIVCVGLLGCNGKQESNLVFPSSISIKSTETIKGLRSHNTSIDAELRYNDNLPNPTLTFHKLSSTSIIDLQLGQSVIIEPIAKGWLVVSLEQNVVNAFYIDGFGIVKSKVAEQANGISQLTKIRNSSGELNSLLCYGFNYHFLIRYLGDSLSITPLKFSSDISSLLGTNQDLMVCQEIGASLYSVDNLEHISSQLDALQSSSFREGGNQLIMKSQFVANNDNTLYNLFFDDSKYKLELYSRNSSTRQYRKSEQSIPLPSFLYEPLGVSLLNDTVYVLFKNGISTISDDGSIISADILPLGSLTSNFSLSKVGNKLTLNDNTSLVILEIQHDPLWMYRTSQQLFLRYALPILLLLLLIYLTFRIFYYRRQLKAVIEYDANAFSFVVDKSMRLRRINNKGRALFSMDSTTPLRRVLRFYCNSDSHRILESFVMNAFADRSQSQQRLPLILDGVEKEIIFTAQVLRSFTGGFVGLYIRGTDITDELERKRLVNWAQLAHDMQTNLSIIKLNAEQLGYNTSGSIEDNKKRILFQATLLLQRVRDIVSIGRDEQLHLVEMDVRELFYEVAQEFDDPTFAYAKIRVQEESLSVAVDKPKMLRALRNTVENSVRALRSSQGVIELSAKRMGDKVFLSVSDTGIGMDEHTKQNFLKPYFSNYRQYGGTGIGTMIILRAIEIHRGTIAVESELGKGTTITFIIPAPRKDSTRLGSL
jgi:signal transduction histidine kinase